MFEREKLSGNNSNDWFRQLKLVLRVEKKMFVIEQPLPAVPAANSDAQVLLQWNLVYDAYNKVACLILSTCKQEEGKPVVAYVIQMKGYVDQLKRLGYVLPQDLILSLILNDLTKDFSRFVRNYNMHNMGKTVGELHDMLIEYEKGLPKKAETPQLMMIRGGKIQKANKKSLKSKGKGKANGKGNDKQVYIPKPKNPKPSAKEHPSKDDACHHCKEVGHWKRNCPVYLAKLEKEASWFYQFFREARKLKQGALYLYVGNGVRAQVEAIGSFDLVLSNGLVICLDNCHYAPSITRGVVSVHHLVKNGFVQRFTDFGILVSKNNVHYFNVIPSNGIYETDMHNLVPNVNSIYNVSTKRAKHNLDSTYLWHCRLAHISKMIRKSFPHRPERVTDLLGIIHTEVCGLLRHVSKHGASYFITFMNDYSRYDRGGEYISQEFKDYLKACGIVQYLTPPYTQQHNGVSERRNRTLLDMVRSMTNLTTLPLSFWDYALESATRIINMVPPKKVDKTPYELCGRAMDLEEIQDKNTSPSEITSEIPMKVEGFEPPQEEEISIRRSERTHRAPNRLCLNVEAEEHNMANGYKTTFLNGYLDEDIYMVQPEDFIDPNHPRKVCKLQRSIYGLKQTSRSWNKRFDEVIKRDRSKRLIGLCQNAYMDKILKRYRMDNSKRGHIPMQERLDLNKTQGASTREEVKCMQNVPYALAVGSIMYDTVVKNILKYLRNTKDMFLVYGGNLEAKLRVDSYCDAGFETDKDDTKSQTGYVFILNGGAVDWKSSKQSTTTMSTTKAEYIAASEAAVEAPHFILPTNREFRDAPNTTIGNVGDEQPTVKGLNPIATPMFTPTKVTSGNNAEVTIGNYAKVDEVTEVANNIVISEVHSSPDKNVTVGNPKEVGHESVMKEIPASYPNKLSLRL
ncbi:retrotransposon protein, putative, ty1-copia subclass [Tanacetum coccineum]